MNETQPPSKEGKKKTPSEKPKGRGFLFSFHMWGRRGVSGEWYVSQARAFLRAAAPRRRRRRRSVCLSERGEKRKEKKNREKVGNWREVQTNERCGEKGKVKIKVCKVR